MCASDAEERDARLCPLCKDPETRQPTALEKLFAKISGEPAGEVSFKWNLSV
jgi:hypothetical protein